MKVHFFYYFCKVIKNALHIAVITLAVIMTACTGKVVNDNTISTTSMFKLGGDSLVMGDTVVYSTDGDTICTNLKVEAGNHIAFKNTDRGTTGTVSTGHKLVDALSAMSAHIVASHKDLHFENSSDLYDAIGLALAYTDPQLSMQLLKEKVDSGVVTGNNSDYYPAYNNRMAWPAAAYRVYQVTGDREWLQYAYDVATATFDQEEDIAFYKRDWLVRGGPSDNTPLVNALPLWMVDSDVFSTFTLSNNVETAQSLLAMGEMAEELGDSGEKFHKLASDLFIAVNENLWNENHGQYTAFIYGQSYTLHAPCCDNRAQALAVMWGLADNDDRSYKLIENTSVSPYGINNFYPSRDHTLDPCLSEHSWGFTQGLWNLASAHVGNDKSLRHGMAALWRAQALYSTRFINNDNATVDFSAAISNIAMTHRVLAGINFEADGLELSPCVPACFPADKTITGFAYRNSTLDITVKGTGYNVDNITVDGKEVNGNFIKASLLSGGHHTITVTMDGTSPKDQGISLADRSMSIPNEPDVTWSGDSAYINNYSPQLAYKLIIDGNMSYSVSNPAFALPQGDNFSELALVAANRYCYSFASRPYIKEGSNFLSKIIPHSDIDKDSININVNVPEGGDYMLSINYITGSTQSDARIISANTHKQGVVVLGGASVDSTSVQTNLIHVDLLPNKNTITITSTPVLRRIASPLTVNIFKK